MKSFITLLIVSCMLTSQLLSAQTTLGIEAGASFANVTIKSSGISVSPKSRTGITAGLILNNPISTNLSFRPALNFVQKGYKITDETGTEKVSFNYIELPLNFVYSIKKNEGFFIGAGPSIAYGISGNDKFKFSGGTMPDDNEKIKFGSGSDQVKTFDFGVNAVAGYRLAGGFTISGSYNLGLSKINNDDESEDNGKIKNRYFSIKIGYMFSGNKHK